MSDLEALVEKADIIITAIHSKGYMISVNDVDTKPRVFIDISIPQALDPKLGEMGKNVYYCVDDINAVIADNKDKRKHESSRAQKSLSNH